jgi:hypothetical protein
VVRDIERVRAVGCKANVMAGLQVGVAAVPIGGGRGALTNTPG